MTSQLLSNSGSTTTPLILYWSSLQNTSFTYDEEYEWWLNNDTMRGITVAGYISCKKSAVAKLDTHYLLVRGKTKKCKTADLVSTMYNFQQQMQLPEAWHGPAQTSWIGLHKFFLYKYMSVILQQLDQRAPVSLPKILLATGCCSC